MVGQLRFTYLTKTKTKVALLAEFELTKGVEGTLFSPTESESLEITKLTLDEPNADLIPLIQGDTLEDVERALMQKLYEQIY